MPSRTIKITQKKNPNEDMKFEVPSVQLEWSKGWGTTIVPDIQKRRKDKKADIGYQIIKNNNKRLKQHRHLTF